MIKRMLFIACTASAVLCAKPIPAEFAEVARLVMRETQDKEVRVGVYRRFSLDDAQNNEQYIEWRNNPDNVLNSDISPRPEQFVLVQGLTRETPEFITIHPYVGGGDFTGPAPITFSGGESTAYILIIRKDESRPSGDLYTLVGGIDNVIAKKDMVPPVAALAPKFNYLFDGQSFGLLVATLSDLLKADTR